MPESMPSMAAGSWRPAAFPSTLNELVEVEAEADIASINAIIAAPNTPWEEVDEDDLEYIQEWLEIWHCI